MRSVFSIFRLTLLSLFLISLLVVPAGLAQQRASEQSDDVIIRISTDLVQTDVAVLDKQGRFVEGLQREQFDLLVDGKLQNISFFEQVAAGSGREAVLVTASRDTRPAPERDKAPTDPGSSVVRGRTVFFFVDDMHLSPDSMRRTQETLQRFVTDTMGNSDQVAITTASGQLGFLQQLTNDKTVLGLAIERLKPRATNITDLAQPPMTEHQALAIERNDPVTLELFIDKTCEEYKKVKGIGCRATGMTNNAVLDEVNVRSDRRGGSSGGSGSGGTSTGGTGGGRGTSVTSTGPKDAEREVKNRARVLTRQATQVTLGTLTSLESLVRKAGPLPERKLLIFVSDGFFINYISATHVYDLRRITDAATRSGTVIYTVDARGLNSGLHDATQSGLFDTSGRAARIKLNEIRDSQQPLYNLAAETGGRSWLNSNDLDPGIAQAINETSNYYLLAWRPETSAQTKEEFRRIKVTIRGRPELTVRVRTGFFAENPDKTNNAAGGEVKSVDDQLLEAIRATYPKRGVPITLSAGYLDRPQDGLVLAASAQIDREPVSSTKGGTTADTELDVIGAAVDTSGNIVSSFKQKVTIPAGQESQSGSVIVTLQFPRLAPGLHQVRFAARDSKTGRIGSAAQWIEIPNVAQGSFFLSSIFLSEGAAGNSMMKPDRRFARTSRLRFQTFVYNAARSTAAPKVVLEMELRRDGQTIIQTPAGPVATDGVTDLARIPIIGEFPLKDFLPGSYELRLTVTDASAKANASRKVAFVIH
jgi:VWFA-related protein